MEVDEDDAAQLPGVPVVQADSAGFDAFGSLLMSCTSPETV
jgi:hypothetical protein